MKYSLDTNIVIALLNGNVEVLHKIKSLKMRECVVSSVVMFELYFGAEKSKRTRENLEKLLKLKFQILEFNENDGKVAGRIRNELNQKGTPIGAYDVLIAGQAINRDLVLITHNVKEFNRIAELKLEDWL
ncbi:MAG: type II toxin-antitoxin system VapC family toxin [Moraxellaceae bacterium]|nr:type II toxin-antitoxin system VapC family toxin [Moraxellaceae bacterium]